jgi:protein-tyrosine-phosphatase
MAERIFKEFLPGHNISSAGVRTVDGLFASENAVSVMEEKGHDLSNHRSRQITEEMAKGSDLILCMTKGHKEYILPVNENTFTIGEYAETFEEIADPFAGSIEEYRRCRDQLYHLLEIVAEKIKNENR